MKALHLTDEELQEYALSGSAIDTSAAEHAVSCEKCKARITEYRLLFKVIKQQQQPVFDFDIAELVMAKLPAAKPITASGNSLIYVFAVAAIALTVAVLYYFRIYIVSLFTGIAPLLIYLTATTIITLAVMLSMDMYKNYHRKMKALDFY